MAAWDALLGGLLRPVFTAMSRARLPQIEGEMRLAGLHAPAEVLRDRWGVPHIYARNESDLFFTQGFVHAQDRLWQMELSRRTAAGRLSEIFGPLALDTDRIVRTFGFARLGAADWQAAPPSVRTIVEAYAAGVNAFLQSAGSRLPVEFSLLRLRPEPWAPLDTMAFSRVMIWQLSHAWYGELLRARMIEAVGEAAAAELEIHYPPANPVALPHGIEFNRLEADGRLQAARGPFLRRGSGSCNWAVAGGKTDTGAPYLCNDMHLALMLPSIWYQNHLVGGGFEVSGVSLAGLPLVLVGHNARIAWGATLAYTDCEDLFVEAFDPGDPLRYRTPDGWRAATRVPEPIVVKGQAEPHIETVVVTRHGPVISDVIGEPARRLAACSMALQPCPALHGWELLNRAAGWDDFVEAVRRIEAPQLSLVYADVEGNIGFWVTGRVPVRGQGDGTLPAPGWSGEHDWTGEVPFEAMPHAFNPAAGFVATSNNRLVPDEYPHFLGRAWMNGYRARVITERLAGSDALGPDDFRALHLDVTCLPGMEFMARLAGLEGEQPDERLALDLLRAWDGRLTTDSVGGAVYEVFRTALVRSLLEPGLGADLATRLMGQGLHPLLLASHEFYGHDSVAVLRMLDNPDSWWMGQAGGREAVLRRSLQQAVA